GKTLATLVFYIRDQSALVLEQKGITMEFSIVIPLVYTNSSTESVRFLLLNWCSFSWTRYRCISVQLWILQFTLFPEGSVFDSQCFWVELRIFAGLLLLVVILHRLESWDLKDNNPDDIEPCSSTNTDISQCPCSTRCRSCTNYNGDNNENSQYPNDAAAHIGVWNPAVEVSQVGLCHVVVRQHSGKGEEHNC